MKHHRFENAAVVLAGSNAAREYLEPIFYERNQELMIAAFCDEQLRLVQLLSFPGSKNEAQISLPDVFRCAIGCAGMILAHNHPGGDPKPSEADIRLTQRLCVVAEAIDAVMLDHLIFASGRMFSFRQAGLI